MGCTLTQNITLHDLGGVEIRGAAGPRTLLLTFFLSAMEGNL